MSVASKILWSEGLTLGPQHFQRQDIYHETRLQRMIAALQPHLWGVRSVQWNLDGLAHNRLGAETMALIFPDGEIYEAPGADLLPDAVDLSGLSAEAQTFTFHAALAAVKPHGGNADQDGRYVRSEAETLDLFSEAVPIDVPFLKKQARLVSHPGVRDVHASLPVVRIRRALQGGFEIDPTFIPPIVAIGAVPSLGRMLEGLISALTAKIEALQRMHRKTSSDLYEVSTGDISSWWMLNIVSTANALLMHTARSPGHHPEALYGQLLGVAGGLMTFSDRYKTGDLPAYRHDALGEVFGKLDALVRDLVDTVIAAKYFLIPLDADKTRRAFYRATLDPAKVTKDTQLCLAVNADVPALELVAAVPVRLKIGAPNDLEKIVGSALPGIPLSHMPQVPSAVPVRPNTYYFLLAAKGPLHENAFKAGELAIYAPDGIPGLKIELIGILS
ncbi:type VI secretion system baseplate subunit TssK [Massilia horti]|uniref:Type VI secretion system baseplate subunit TssK n=1 Tax=Massilia horti TaxID=2562153 RepID=A0A4Y9T9F1_9BURK|nr:type VI secretion system baseplate subunit TssK [Massilia horti]TFW34625.1 type VI secretion system baseplate subunit TssK [Massilia horti]